MMDLEGNIWKDGKSWLIEVPAIEVMTQRHCRKEALNMLCDLLKALFHVIFPIRVKALR
jgi:hypothetical protein